MKRIFKQVVVALLVSAVVGAEGRGEVTEGERTAIVSRLDGRAEHFANISRRIWEFAEVGYQETQSAALLKEELRRAGFLIKDNIANIPTAFSAQAGSGGAGHWHFGRI